MGGNEYNQLNFSRKELCLDRFGFPDIIFHGVQRLRTTLSSFNLVQMFNVQC
jgi:hypothetical protein